MQIFEDEENRYIFIFYLPNNSKFLQDAISGIIFYIHANMNIEFHPKMEYICFDLMFLSKINQVISVAILLFLDLRSVLQKIFCDILLSLIPFFSFRWMLFSDKENYNQVNWNYMVKKDASITFCKFLEKFLYFHLLSALQHQVFSVSLFRLLPIALFSFYL